MNPTALLREFSIRALERATLRRGPDRFNAVTLLAPGENRLSAAFRWLLDERESHGEGPLFRDRFVSRLLDETPDDWAGARVRCEVSTADGGGRMDIVIETPDGGQCIVIENKPWAGWQTEQLPRYLRDQSVRRRHVRVHALLGDADPRAALARHWSAKLETMPSCVDASGFDAVADWLETCAAEVRSEKVRWFVVDLAGYCREAVMQEIAMDDVDAAADLILAGGSEAIDAAGTIAAALPLAMTKAVAKLAAGQVEMIGANPSIALRNGDAVVNFVLFGASSPWAGATTAERAAKLAGDVVWSAPERKWPRWAWLKRVGEPGVRLAEAVARGDRVDMAQRMPAVAATLVGARLPAPAAEEPA